MKEFLFRRGFVLPVTVTGVVPVIVLTVTRAFEHVTLASAAIGGSAWAAGLFMLAWTSRLFDAHGGALAPWNPPKTIVLSGPYRYVRNPMISGIFAMLLGEAVAFRSPWLASWLGFFVCAQFVYVRFDEEPALRKRFGAAYEAYCRDVPRWIPRLSPRPEPSDHNARP